MSFKHRHDAFVQASPASVFTAIANPRSWPDWDEAVQAVEAPVQLRVGDTFTLKPKGGPLVKITVLEQQSPCSHIDQTAFFGARMTVAHTITAEGTGSRLATEVSVEGPLAWVWNRLVAKGVAKGLPNQATSLEVYLRRPSS